MKSLIAPLPTLALLLVLSACGSDESDGTAGDPDPTTASPSPSASSSSEGAEDLCAAVTDADLSGWARRPMAAATQASASGVTECTAVSEDGAVVVTWQTQEAAPSLEEEVARADADGLRRSSTTVAGRPAALLTGTRPSGRSAKVVAILGDRSLYVDTGWLDGVGPEASPAILKALAVGVADRAAGAEG